MQEPPDRKPDWLDDDKTFSLKNVYTSLNKIISRILLQIGSKETGRYFCRSEPYLFFLPFHGKFHLTSAWPKTIERGLRKEGPHNFNIQKLILFTIFSMFLFDIWTLVKRFWVRNSKFFESSLLFFGSEHCSTKQVIKRFSFFSEINNAFVIMKYRRNARNLFII